MSVDNATTGVDSIDQGDGDDALIFTSSNQTQDDDLFIGGTGTDTILVSADVTLLAYQVLPFGGFFGYEAITLSADASAQFSANQFGAGLISNSLHLIGTNGTQEAIVILAAQNFSAAHWTFTDWETADLIEIFGNNAGNVLTGSSQGEIIVGDDGADVLTGGRGKDTLVGGNDNDTFRFLRTTDSLKGDPDVISDFSHADGDHIDLHKIDANTKIAGNQAFHFIFAQGFHHKAGELHLVDGGANVFVEGDVNGHRKADFLIDVSVSAMGKDDFIL
jgi:Ca2+-binding RTX toxin-like protein